MNSTKTVFVIMPFSASKSRDEAEWSEVYQHVFMPAIIGSGYECERIEPATGSLITSIIDKLRHAQIVLADITDQNPNVLYELGVRHALRKGTIIVAQDVSHIPSDLRGYWSIIYGTSPGQVDSFATKIREMISEIESDPERSDSPVADFLQKEFASVATYVGRDNVKKLGALYTELSGNIIELKEWASSPRKRQLFVSDDCLKLLLQTLYVDVGTELVRECYEVQHEIATVRQLRGKHGRRIANGLIRRLEQLSQDVMKLRRRIALNDFIEPDAVSIMEWRPNARRRTSIVGRISAPNEEFRTCVRAPLMSENRTRQ